MCLHQGRGGSTATKEGTGEYVDDSVIATKVKTAKFNDSSLKVNEMTSSARRWLQQ